METNPKVESIKKLIKATKEKKINWIAQNKTTYYTVKKNTTGGEFVISIQHSSNVLFFIIRKTNATDSFVDYNSISNPEMTAVLKELYEIASLSVSQKTIDFLDDLFKDL